jgi:hypothetical protein
MLRAAIKMALRRPSLPEIPLTGPEVRKVNCYVLTMGDDTVPRRFLAKGLERHHVKGLWFEERGRLVLRCRIRNEMLEKATSFCVKHYIRGYVLEYHSPIEFILKDILAYRWWVIWPDRTIQFLFNRRKLLREDRIQVLRLFVEKTIEENDFRAGRTGVMSMLYSDRWVRHPEQKTLSEYYHLLLQSLTESGELAMKSYDYVITPKALTTLSRHEEEDRRHKDQVRQQIILSSLTFALVAVGCFQAWHSV